MGTLIAQYAGFLMGIVLWMHNYGRLKRFWEIKNYKLKIKGREGAGIWEKEAMFRFFQVNRDIFLRTLCLVAVTLFFTSAGASQGEIILAVNTLLMQLFTLFSYVMDGFAYAGEALSGRYIGARNREAFTDTVRHLFGWGAVMAVLFTLVYALGGNAFLGLLTDDKEVIAVADTYFLLGACRAAVGIAASSGTASSSVPPPREECSSPWQRQLSAFLSYIMGCIPSWQTMLYGLPSSLTC